MIKESYIRSTVLRDHDGCQGNPTECCSSSDESNSQSSVTTRRKLISNGLIDRSPDYRGHDSGFSDCGEGEGTNRYLNRKIPFRSASIASYRDTLERHRPNHRHPDSNLVVWDYRPSLKNTHVQGPNAGHLRRSESFYQPPISLPSRANVGPTSLSANSSPVKPNPLFRTPATPPSYATTMLRYSQLSKMSSPNTSPNKCPNQDGPYSRNLPGVLEDCKQSLQTEIIKYPPVYRQLKMSKNVETSIPFRNAECQITSCVTRKSPSRSGPGRPVSSQSFHPQEDQLKQSGPQNSHKKINDTNSVIQSFARNNACEIQPTDSQSSTPHRQNLDPNSSNPSPKTPSAKDQPVWMTEAELSMQADKRPAHVKYIDCDKKDPQRKDSSSTLFDRPTPQNFHRNACMANLIQSCKTNTPECTRAEGKVNLEVQFQHPNMSNHDKQSKKSNPVSFIENLVMKERASKVYRSPGMKFFSLRRKAKRHEKRLRRNVSHVDLKAIPSRVSVKLKSSDFIENSNNERLEHKLQNLSIEGDFPAREQTSKESKQVKFKVNISPVTQWLCDVRILGEAECLHMLQSKSLATDESVRVVMGVKNCRDVIRGAVRNSSKLMDDIKSTQSSSLTSKLLTRVEEFVLDYHCLGDPKLELDLKKHGPQEARSELDIIDKCLATQEQLLVQICSNLRGRIHGDIKGSPTQVLTALLPTFRKTVTLVIKRQLKLLQMTMMDPGCELVLKATLYAVPQFCQESEQVVQMLWKMGFIRQLLNICAEGSLAYGRILSLRSLAAICVTPENIRQFYTDGGLEILHEFIKSPNRVEAELVSVAEVLAQVTSPHHEDHILLNRLGKCSGEIVHQFTELCHSTKDNNSFLKAATVLSNLSFVDKKSMDVMLHSKTVPTIIQFTRNKNDLSVFSLDQIVTILANVATKEEGRRQILRHGGLVTLLKCLQLSPKSYQESFEVSACEKVLQKSSIGMARLCCDVTTAIQIVEFRGVVRLVQLCRDYESRNDSDSVLIAALAALRKIVASCGPDVIKGLEAEELVSPCLLDSFLMFSSRPESYV